MASGVKYEIRWYCKAFPRWASMPGIVPAPCWRLTTTKHTRWWWRVKLAFAMQRLFDLMPPPPCLFFLFFKVRVRIIQ